MGYLTNFIVYTFAMIGVISVALLVFKGSTFGASKGKSKNLKIHDSLSLGPRKTLYIVSAGNEKFLIAGDVDKTALISKLETTTSNVSPINNEILNDMQISKSFKDTIDELPVKKQYIDRKGLGIYSPNTKPYNSVMKNLAERIKG